MLAFTSGISSARGKGVCVGCGKKLVEDLREERATLEERIDKVLERRKKLREMPPPPEKPAEGR